MSVYLLGISVERGLARVQAAVLPGVSLLRNRLQPCRPKADQARLLGGLDFQDRISIIGWSRSQGYWTSTTQRTWRQMRYGQ
jgi:hypothetical protein